MQTYKIIMTPDVTDDITELSRYIAKNLFVLCPGYKAGNSKVV